MCSGVYEEAKVLLSEKKMLCHDVRNSVKKNTHTKNKKPSHDYSFCNLGNRTGLRFIGMSTHWNNKKYNKNPENISVLETTLTILHWTHW